MKIRTKILEHWVYYIAELVVIMIGFYLMMIMSYSVILQFIVLALTLGFYITISIIHHMLNHYITSKIVIEYVLMSSLILTTFLFLNSARL